MNKVEKIKAEIERMKKSLPWGSCASQVSMECNCKNEAYNEILSYIDSLEEEPESNGLEEASRKNVVLETKVMKDSDGDGIDTPYEEWLTLEDTEIPFIPDNIGIKDGDKVKLIIIKDENY